ncbi:MAG TPA: hypothetical protein PLU93_12535 [Treponemataceae bacterium]|nr:hypothetical protein [Treponemataceae bacterium]
MDKRMNTILFVVVSTLVNLLIAFLVIALLLVAVNFIIPAKSGGAPGMMMFAIIGGVIISMIVHQNLVRWVIERFNLEDKLEPFFVSRNKRKK